MSTPKATLGPNPGGSRGPAKGRRGFWPLRDLPGLLYLTATAVVAVLHPFVPVPRWLMIHFVMLGAVSHSILVWSRHFATTLLHSPPDDRTAQSRRLLLFNGGVVAVALGLVADVWPLTVAGAGGVAGAAISHGWTLWRKLRAALPTRFAVTVRYYIAAAAFLPVGAALGAVLARGLADPWHTRTVLAHVAVNVLGWVGLTVFGTLVTLWPAMLRTRIADGAERAAAQALPVFVASAAGVATAGYAGSRLGVAAALLGYAAGIGITGRALAGVLRRKRPATFPAMSALAALLWLAGTLLALAAGIATAPTWSAAYDWLRTLTPFLVAGFAAQILLGALSYLVPVTLGGGPGPVRAANAVIERGAPLRVVVTNAGLLVCALPVPSAVRVLTSMLVLATLAAALPLLLMSIRASRAAKAKAAAAEPAPGDAPDAPPERPAGQRAGLAATGLATVVLTVAAGVAVDSTALGSGTSTPADAGVTPTGKTTTVEVRAADMRFTPSTIPVPAGDRLVLHVINADDEDVHDLVLDDGSSTGRLSPGESAELDVGVVGRDLDGWCSVLGHRQMGMVLEVRVTGRPPEPDDTAPGRAAHDPGRHAPDADDGSPLDPSDFRTAPEETFRAHDAALPPLEPGRVHRHTFTIREIDREVAPGVTQRMWTYDGTVPGPVLHGRVGDEFVITLVNRGTIGHSIDFHAGALAPQRPMRTIAPGESLVYRFRATRAGVWMYHCATTPMSAHIANGLFGAVVIEPRGLPPVDRSYLLVQSELYLGAGDGGEDATVDTDKLAAERPEAVVFNGYANQYDHRPLPARVGERVRVWVLNAGPNRPSSFHVVGGQFDTVYREGAYLLGGDHGREDGGAQALGLLPSQGGFVELTFPEPGDYPFITHVMVDAERGAHGLFRVTR